MGRVIYFADLFAGIGGFHCGLKKAITHSDILKKNKFELTADSEK